RAAVTAERSLLRALEAGCSAPVAAYAELESGAEPGPGPDTAPAATQVLRLRALAIRPDGTHVVEGEARVDLDLAADALSGPGSARSSPRTCSPAAPARSSQRPAPDALRRDALLPAPRRRARAGHAPSGAGRASRAPARGGGAHGRARPAHPPRPEHRRGAR